MKLKFVRCRRRKAAGFSLVELMIALAILGVLGAMILGSITDTTEAAEEAQARRNAQILSSMAIQASSIGSKEITPGMDKDTVVAKLLRGVRGEGAMNGVKVQMSTMSEAELNRAKDYLEVNGGVLSIRP